MKVPALAGPTVMVCPGSAVALVSAATGSPSTLRSARAPASATRTGPPSTTKEPPSTVNSIAASPGALPTSMLATASAILSMAPAGPTP